MLRRWVRYWPSVPTMTCRGCGSAALSYAFGMDPMPLAGGFADTPAAARAAPVYPMEWYWCSACGLVNTAEDIPDDILYRHYRYASSDVPALVRHFDGLASFLKVRYGPSPIRLVEIGCNDGILLRRLPASWDLIGVDPSDIASQAEPKGYRLIGEPFSSDLAHAIGYADVVTSSNALAHFTAIGDAWDGIADLHPREVWIEVHDLDATLGSGQWDTVYHEHKVEWSVESLVRAGAVRGYEAIIVKRLPLHGGLLRVGFRRGSVTPAQPVRPDFAYLAAVYAARFDSLAYLAVQGAPRALAYGAAGRATVYLNQLPDLAVRAVVDGSPRRIGRFIPGRALEIVEPAAFDSMPPDVTIITAWNHAADIRARHPDYTGRWVTAW